MSLTEKGIQALTEHKFQVFQPTDPNQFYAAGSSKQRCVYGWVVNTDHVIECQNKACHAEMSYPGNIGAYGQRDKKYVSMDACFNIMYGDIPEVFYDWLVDKKVSPWRNILDGAFIFDNTAGQKTLVLADMNHSGQVLTSIMKASRMFTEDPEHGKVFSRLVAEGAHPSIAFYMAQFMKIHGVDKVNLTHINWHGSVFQYDAYDTFKNFVQGVYKTDGNKYGTGQYNYGGVDSIFNGADVGGSIANSLNKKFGLNGREAYNSRWCGVVYHDNMNIKSLAEVCKKLQQEMGLDDYVKAA